MSTPADRHEGQPYDAASVADRIKRMPDRIKAAIERATRLHHEGDDVMRSAAEALVGRLEALPPVHAFYKAFPWEPGDMDIVRRMGLLDEALGAALAAASTEQPDQMIEASALLAARAHYVLAHSEDYPSELPDGWEDAGEFLDLAQAQLSESAALEAAWMIEHGAEQYTPFRSASRALEHGYIEEAFIERRSSRMFLTTTYLGFVALAAIGVWTAITRLGPGQREDLTLEFGRSLFEVSGREAFTRPDDHTGATSDEAMRLAQRVLDAIRGK